ncbi:ABC transporter transmembrane region [Aspergillus sclerotialis]|uniref:ABC transporter transmembrane region n=1 Tax=Aspergillus sclerotialis TaxID=2070753 RepID=A0A3A3AAV7_9EURO|nr:ABC transporter transmembrane region [Aspergillus sclerotialis]
MAMNATEDWYLCPYNADGRFGPSIDRHCRGGFDFTLTFEQSILSIAPSALLLLFAPLRLYWLSGSNLKTNASFSAACSSKLLASAALAGLQVALLVIWVRNPQAQTVASIPAAVLSLVDALAICLLSYMEHTRSIRPSTLLGVFFLASLVLDIPQSRTLFLMGDITPLAAVFTAVMALKVILLVLEGRSKIQELRHPYHQFPPESTGNVWMRLAFWWLNPMFFKGFARLLSVEDLWSMDEKLATFNLREQMHACWSRRVHSESPYALVMASVSCMRWALLSVVWPRLAMIGFKYAQPFLISSVISFVEAPSSKQPRSHALGLIAAAFLVYLGIALTTVAYKRQMYRMISMTRGALVSLIYTQTLKMRDGSYDESAALTLMSTDVDRIVVGLQNFHEVWARIVEIAIGMWLLAEHLGPVAVVPIGLISICTLANSQLSKLITGRQKVWNAAVQKRIAVISSMLGSMKSMKIMGMTQMVYNSVQEHRLKEIQLAMGYRWLSLWTNTIASVPVIFAPVLMFVVFVAQASARGDRLTTNQAFTSLSIISLVTQPASLLMYSINETAAMKGCFDRLQKFLRAPPASDTRNILCGPKTIDSSAETSLDQTSDQRLEEQVYVIRGEKGPESYPHPTGRGIEVDQAIIRPAPSVDPVLTQLSMNCPAGSLTMVVGPVGCGKSTLLRAVLGEVPCDKGVISVSSTDIALCSQSPWLPNGTVKDVICGFCDEGEIDESWFQAVIHACALEDDLARLPEAEKTVIGSRGVTLSGGQKQRVALARAVYARCKIVLLDDVLSALDQKTEAIVVKRLFGAQGLLRQLQATILLVTHSTDRIIVLTREGTVKKTLTSQDIQDSEISQVTLEDDGAPGLEDVPGASSRPRPKIKAPNAGDSDLTRKTGDMTLYTYYFQSFGWLRTFGFLACAAVFTFATAFQQIWLEWWADVHGQFIGKYMSVYVVLAVGALLFRCLTFWWCLIWMSPISSANLHEILLRVTVK